MALFLLSYSFFLCVAGRASLFQQRGEGGKDPNKTTAKKRCTYSYKLPLRQLAYSHFVCCRIKVPRYTHRVDTALGFFSSRPNLDSPTPSPRGRVCTPPPTFGSGEGHTRLRERVVGWSQFGRGDRHCGTAGIMYVHCSHNIKAMYHTVFKYM
jgi:hypothetical protein